MKFNQAQTAYLNQFPGIAFKDLSADQRLHVANLAHEPDEAAITNSEPDLTEAQKLYLSTFPDGLESMDDVQRAVFDGMGPKPSATTPAGQQPASSTPATPGRPGEWFRLDEARIAHLPPERRLELQEHVDVLNADRKAAMAGVPAERREATRNHIDSARSNTAVYLLAN